MNNPSQMKGKKGFSLPEVLISVFILAVVGGIASISFLNLSPKYRLKRAVWEINSQMNYARYKAIFYGIKVRIAFKTAGYSIEKYNEELEQWELEREFILEGVTIQANNTPIFHPAGTVSNLASIYVSNSWGMYKITLAISGRIKVIQI